MDLTRIGVGLGSAGNFWIWSSLRVFPTQTLPWSSSSPILLLISWCFYQWSLSFPKILGSERFPQGIFFGKLGNATSNRDPKSAIPKFTRTTGKLLVVILHHVPTFSLAQKSAFPQKTLIFILFFHRFQLFFHNLLDLGKPLKLWNFFGGADFENKDSRKTFKWRIWDGQKIFGMLRIP